MSVELYANLDSPFGPDRKEALISVSVEVKEKRQVAERHIAILVDTSTSMRGDKIERARAGVMRVLNELSDDDYVSIIAFDTSTEVVLPMTKWADADESDVRRAVDGTDSDEYDGELDADGGTRIPDGLEAARDQFAETPQTARVSEEIVLLSDGKDERPSGVYESLARDISDRGISIVAAGIGSSYQEEVMLTLARESGGEPFDLDESKNIETFLGERVEEAGKVVAGNPELHVDVGSEFVLDPDEDVYFTEPEVLSKSIESVDDGGVVELPRLKDGSRHELTIAVLASPNPTGVTYRVADLAVRDGERVLATTSIDVAYEEDLNAQATVEKRRRAAKLVVEMSSGDTTHRNIDQTIDEMEKEGWTGIADDLKQRLDRSDEDGGAIEITKEPIDTD